MSTTDYATDLEKLKESLNQLNKKGLDLSSAMQTYQQGLQHHERCVNTLTSLEKSIENTVENSECTSDVVEFRLEEIFASLENIEQSIESLPETNLESCLDLLIQAERLLQAGYHQIDLAADTLNNTGEKNIGSRTLSGTDEVHRV